MSSTPLNEENLLQQTTEESPSSSICSQHIFAFECQNSSCCASYHQRFLMLLFSIFIFIIALIVFIFMIISVQWRPLSLRQRREKRISEVELKSFEETKYLRRMSELNPNIRRETGE
uniref:Uncharacterized protein n=1 Tax=Meloidogyne enterolobii TaxID=390850 RepID=A0A6V7V0K8_MELEN|nr:unnamed protein product [Meloidogyne enterolobii]